MRDTHWWKGMRLARILSLVFLMLTGCGGSSSPGDSPASSGTSRLLLRVTTADQGSAGQTTRAGASGQTRQTGGRATRVQVEVRGVGMQTPVVVQCLVTGPTTSQCRSTDTPTALTVEIEIVVPSGPERTVTVQVFDDGETLLQQGVTTVDAVQATQVVTVVLRAVNTPPVANAGADQTVAVGTTVTLRGTGSSDAAGKPLTFAWTLLLRPSGSQAALSNPSSVTPTLVVDRPGTYMAQLTVANDTLESLPDVVTVTTTNSAPVANAGPAQTVSVGTTVTLQGNQSSDVDGDTLTLQWILLSRPATSQATLTNPNTLNPTFVVDRRGTYVAQLVVGDGQMTSVPATVTISTTNSTPVANTGPSQTVVVGATVTLDGSGSSDVDGDALTFTWALTTRPAGSQATLTTPASVNPTFVVDEPGMYVAQLTVTDASRTSTPATVTVTTRNSAPVANAGPPQSVSVGTVVRLDGRASRDPDHDPLRYTWALIVLPRASTARLATPDAVQPTFTVDRPGDYVAQLIVNDGLLDSAPTTVTISTLNSTPVANAGADQVVRFGATVGLDGRASSDADRDALTFAWSLTTRPAGSSATLSNPTSATPTFIVDRLGTYVAQLLVNDGTTDSPPDTVQIVVQNTAPVANAGSDQLVDARTSVLLDGRASLDVDGDALTFRWTQTRGPGVTLSNATTAQPTCTAPEVAVDTTLTFQLVVSDGRLDSAPDVVDILVRQVNQVPVANAGPDQAVPVGATVTLDGSRSSDGNGDPLTFAWTLITFPGGSRVTLTNPTSVRPTFVVDVSGTYVAQLTVHDGTARSTPDTVQIVTTNSAPIANAGPDQTALVGATVTLDGRGSSDSDGTPLIFAWTVTTRPAGSSATLTNPTSVMPTFGVDRAGTYEMTLIVNDGTEDSAPDTVRIVTTNSAPVANAGPGQTAMVGATVRLDGSASSDVDGDTLTFSWTLVTRPAGSSATLTNPMSVMPTFVLDHAGTYTAQLIVNDGALDSVPATVTITTGNSAPVANAGTDQTAPVGATVTLDGSGSSDVDGDAVTFAWTLTTIPPGSSATLTDPTGVMPTFVLDHAGTYEAQLIVHDGTVHSAPDTVMISTTNSAPVAHAGPDQTIDVGLTVTLDGNDSNDVDGDVLTFAWAFTTIPPGSAATLTNPTSANPTFVPDVIGMYVTQLIVHDGTVAGTPDTVLITTTSRSVILALVNTTVVGVGRPATLQATLSAPAPSGGVTITVRSDQPTLLTITAPGTIAIPAGGTTGQVTVNGLAAGSATVRGNAPGYTEGTLAVSVTLNLISLPATLNVPLGQTVSIPVTIAPSPAPAGGVAVSLVSNNTSAVQVLTPTVTIPAGSLSANGTVRGAGIGMATITGSNVNYAPAISQVSTTANLNIVQTSATVNGSFTADITVQIESAGSPIAAPAPGITVTLTAADPACAVVTSPVTILTGQVNTMATISGGTAPRPCSTTVTASAPNIVADMVPVTVNPTPALTLSPTVVTVGAGLQERCCQVFLGAPAPAGGVQVQVQSSNAGTVLLAPDVATVGTSTLTLSLAAGSTVSNLFVVQGLETAPSLPATVTLTATAPGFTAATSAITVVQPGLRLSGGPTSTTTLSADTPFAVEVGVPNAPANTGLNSLQAVRVGGPTLTATVTNAMAGVAQLTTSAGVGQSHTVQIRLGQFSTPLTVATGGVAFDPLTAGATTVQATIPGFIATTAATVVVTVTAPALTLAPTTVTVGAGLQELCCRVFLGAPAPAGGVQVQVQSSDVGTVLLAPDGATVGTSTLTLSIAAGGMVSNLFVMQGLETAPSLPATVTLTATAPGFTAATSAITVVQPGLRLRSLTASTTTLSADTPFAVEVGVPNAPANTGLNLVQAVRVGGPTLTATVTNTVAGVAQLTTSAGSAQSRTVQIGPGQFSSPGTVATGGVAFDPLTAGSTTVQATIPGFIATTAATVGVTVTASALTLSPTTVTVGAGLQELCCQVSLDTPAPAGGVQVQVQSEDAATLLLAPDVGTVGTPTMTLTIAAGNSASSFFFVQGLETAPSLPAIISMTATAPGFTAATGAITVVSPGLRLLSVPISTTTLSADTPFRVQVGVPNAPTNTTVGVQAVRVGGPTLTATVTNAMAGVAQLTTSVGSAQSRTVQIGPGQSSTPLTVATGGVAFDPLTAGSTTVQATIPGFIATTAATVTVTVSAPALTLSPTVATVGAGLQELCCRVFLGAPAPAGGVQVQVQSSDVGTVLLAPDGATVGTSTLTLTIAAGNSASTFFVVQGLETAPSLPATVTLTATAPGFIDTTNAITVVQPGLRLSGVPPSTTMGSADTPFLVHVGVPNAPANTGLNSLQAVRVGGPTLTATVTNTVAGVAQLTTSAGVGQSRTAQIGPGQSSTPLTVATGGVAFDPLTAGSTTVQAAIPGFIATTAATVGVTVTP